MAREIAEDLGPPLAIKAQALVGGRGKAGGIKFANSPAEAEERARELLGTALRGENVCEVLVEKFLEIEEV